MKMEAGEIPVNAISKYHDDTVRQDCEAFSELYAIRWESEISLQANRTTYQKKKNNTKELPLSEDVSKLSKHLSQEGINAMARLLNKTMEPFEIKQAWARLSEVTFTSIILFHRIRQGEASKMTVADYKNGLEKQTHNDDVLSGLSKFEQALCKQMMRIEITGKRGGIVPVILTDETKSFTELLLEMRAKAGVAKDKTFFFARANNDSTGHLRGSDCLRNFTEEIPLQKPLLLRSTTLRKQIATLTQLISLKENELDVIAQYMGHGIRIHREHYRLPSATLQVAKVAKLLMTLEKGQVSNDLEDNEDEDETNASNDNSVEKSDSSGDSDAECTSYQAPSVGAKTTRAKALAQRVMSDRKKWTTEEERACLEHFNRYITLGTLPGKAKITEVIQNVPALSRSSWIQVKNFIRNHNKKSQKSFAL